MEWKCSHCGAINHSKFCRQCGTPYAPPDSAGADMRSSSTGGEKTRDEKAAISPAAAPNNGAAPDAPSGAVPSATVPDSGTEPIAAPGSVPPAAVPDSGTAQTTIPGSTPPAAVPDSGTKPIAAPGNGAAPSGGGEIFCSTCGAKNSLDACFCAQCGAALAAAKGTASTAASSKGSSISGKSNTPGGPGENHTSSDSGGHKTPSKVTLLLCAIVAVLVIVLIILLTRSPGGNAATASTSSAPGVSMGLGPDDTTGTPSGSTIDISTKDTGETPLEGRYAISINQIDTTEYPGVKLYLDIKDLNTDDVPKNLDKTFFYLEEKTEGMDDYIKREITNVLQLDEKESLNTCMVMDISGSMAGSSLQSAQNMMISFLQNVQFGYGDRIGLIAFSSEVYEIMNFTGDRTQMVQSIEQLAAMDQTSLYDALYRAVQRTSMQNGAKCVIAFTDGNDNASSYTPEDIKALAQQYKIPIFIIGTGVDEEYRMILADLCESVNGFYKNIDDIDSVAEIYSEIYQTQKDLYLVEYKTDTKAASSLTHEVRLALQVTAQDTQNDADKGQNAADTNAPGSGQAQISYKPELLASTENTAADDGAYAEYIEKNIPTIIAGKKEKYRVDSIEFVPLAGLEYTDRFENGIARVRDTNGKWGFVDTNLNYVVKPTYDKLFYANDNMIVVCRNNRWGYINTNGEVKVPLSWDGFPDADVSDSLLNKEVPFMVFSEGRGIVLSGSRYGYVDREGTVIIQPQFEDAKPFHQGLAAVKKNGQWGYINKIGEFIIQPKFAEAGSFAENLAPVMEKGKKYGYIDLSGNYKIAPRFDLAEDFESEAGRRYAKVYEDGGCGLIQTDGSYKLSPDWKEAWNYADGYAMVRDKDGKYGFADSRGRIKLSPRYNMAYRSNLGLVAYCNNKGRWGFDTIDGKKLEPADYDFATNFAQGVARVQKNEDGKTTIGLLDPDGNFLTNGLDYTSIGYPGSGYCPAMKDGQWGFLKIHYKNRLLW